MSTRFLSNLHQRNVNSIKNISPYTTNAQDLLKKCKTLKASDLKIIDDTQVVCKKMIDLLTKVIKEDDDELKINDAKKAISIYQSIPEVIKNQISSTNDDQRPTTSRKVPNPTPDAFIDYLKPKNKEDGPSKPIEIEVQLKKIQGKLVLLQEMISESSMDDRKMLRNKEYQLKQQLLKLEYDLYQYEDIYDIPTNSFILFDNESSQNVENSKKLKINMSNYEEILSGLQQYIGTVSEDRKESIFEDILMILENNGYSVGSNRSNYKSDKITSPRHLKDINVDVMQVHTLFTTLKKTLEFVQANDWSANLLNILSDRFEYLQKEMTLSKEKYPDESDSFDIPNDNNLPKPRPKVAQSQKPSNVSTKNKQTLPNKSQQTILQQQPPHKKEVTQASPPQSTQPTKGPINNVEVDKELEEYYSQLSEPELLAQIELLRSEFAELQDKLQSTTSEEDMSKYFQQLHDLKHKFDVLGLYLQKITSNIKQRSLDEIISDIDTAKQRYNVLKTKIEGNITQEEGEQILNEMKEILNSISALNSELQDLSTDPGDSIQDSTDQPSNNRDNIEDNSNNDEEDIGSPQLQLKLLKRVEEIRTEFIQIKSQLEQAKTEEETTEILGKLKNLMVESEQIEAKLKKFEETIAKQSNMKSNQLKQQQKVEEIDEDNDQEGYEEDEGYEEEEGDEEVQENEREGSDYNEPDISSLPAEYQSIFREFNSIRNQLTDPSPEESARLHKRLEELQNKLKKLKSTPPEEYTKQQIVDITARASRLPLNDRRQFVESSLLEVVPQLKDLPDILQKYVETTLTIANDYADNHGDDQNINNNMRK